jgi:SAM-dependent methyltransferase
MLWSCKLAAKIALSNLGLPYSFWRHLGFFRHGRMDTSSYALKIFRLHAQRAYPNGVPEGLRMLELGPGDSVASALIAYSHKVNSTVLVDVAAFAKTDIQFYKNLCTELAAEGLSMPSLSECDTFEQVLKNSKAQYLTEGMISLKSIHSESVDFIWSHSVLEHIRKHDVQDVLCELKRILRPNGLMSHNIDFRDHLSGSLNNLRFSNKLWESNFFTRAGFYTNRIPAMHMHKMFREMGFNIKQEGFGRWDNIPISRSLISKDFKQLSDNELTVRTSHILMSK